MLLQKINITTFLSNLLVKATKIVWKNTFCFLHRVDYSSKKKQFHKMSGIAEKSSGGGLWEQIRYWEGKDGLDTVKVKIYTLTYHIIYMIVSILCPFDNLSSTLTSAEQVISKYLVLYNLAAFDPIRLRVHLPLSWFFHFISIVTCPLCWGRAPDISKEVSALSIVVPSAGKKQKKKVFV